MAKRRFARLWALLLALALLPGCSFADAALLGGSVEGLLRAPQLTGQASAVQRALTSHLGSGITFKYPASGDFLTPFWFGDWDGDGVQEAAALYTAADGANVSLAVLEPEGDSGWRVVQTAEGLSGEVESIHIAHLRDASSGQLLVGYGSAQGDRYLVVYLYSDETLEPVLSQAYDQFLLTGVTGRAGADDLVLALPGEGENTGVTLQLLTYREGEGFHSAQTPAVGGNQLTACAALQAGTTGGGAPYLLLDGWSGATAGSLFSLFITYNSESGFLEPWLPESVQDPFTETQRYDVALLSRDLDDDGDVDIPVEVMDGGTVEEALLLSVRFLEWRDFVGRFRGTSIFGVYDSDNRFFLPLPRSLRGRVTIRANVAGNGWMVCDTSGREIYCELRVITPVDGVQDARYTQVASIGSRQLQARVVNSRSGLRLEEIAAGIVLL